MRRSIILLSLLLLAVPAVANELPVEYICVANPDMPGEGAFCAGFKAALLKTGFITYDRIQGKPFFHIIVLPTMRDDYTAVTVASNFIYPPLNGLALSAYFAGFIIRPGGVTESNLDEIANRVVSSTAEWMIAAADNVIRLDPQDCITSRPVLETNP